jgi:hypothetical protein
MLFAPGQKKTVSKINGHFDSTPDTLISFTEYPGNTPFIIGAPFCTLLYSNYSIIHNPQLMDPDKAKSFSRCVRKEANRKHTVVL